MKKLKNKSSRIEYSDNYYRSNPNTSKNKEESKAFNFDEFLEIIGTWIYEKARKYFESEKA